MFIQLFFLYCAVMILGCGLLAVTMKNPVHCLLMVLVLFFHMAAIYLTLSAEFLAAVQVIVYAGAILVLYLLSSSWSLSGRNWPWNDLLTRPFSAAP